MSVTQSETKCTAKITITEGNFDSNASASYYFDSKNIPLTWTSYGEFLLIVIETNHCQLWLMLLAVFVPESLSKAMDREVAPLFMRHCPRDQLHTILSRKICYKIVNGFYGNWMAANEVCKQEGGYLWSVNTEEEWWTILQADREKQIMPGSTYEMPIHAVKYFASSSLIYLGSKLSEREASILFVQYMNIQEYLSILLIFQVFW
jgi:hypothetical protein